MPELGRDLPNLWGGAVLNGRRTKTEAYVAIEEDMKTPIPRPLHEFAAPSTLLGIILPDELPWSYTGRLRNRYPKTSHESLSDFVGTVPSYRKGYPTQLRSLAAALRYKGAPNLEELILRHTFFPYSLPEISSAEADRLFNSMADETFPLAVPETLKHSANFSLRVCECCIAQDTERFGYAYYHCVHQIPGVLRCPTEGHGYLLETRVTAATRDYTDPTDAIVFRRELDAGNLAITPHITNAYFTLGRLGRDSCDRDQARAAFIELADRKGHWAGTTVKPSLARRVRGKYSQTAFRHFRLFDPIRLDTWLTVPGLAVACLAFDVSFEEFVANAKQIKLDIPPPPPPSAIQLELFDLVKTMAPRIVSELRASSTRVSIWALSTQIDQITGRNFASNWSWRSPFRELLREQIHAAQC